MSFQVRKKQLKKESRLNRLLEIPKEISTNEPRIVNMGFNKMLIENYKIILEYQDFFIRIGTQIGIINVNGFELKLNEMTPDETRNLCIEDLKKLETYGEQQVIEFIKTCEDYFKEVKDDTEGKSK